MVHAHRSSELSTSLMPSWAILMTFRVLKAVNLPDAQEPVQVPHWKHRFNVDEPVSMIFFVNCGSKVAAILIPKSGYGVRRYKIYAILP